MSSSVKQTIAGEARFITIEGVEGVGKTTNLEYVRRFFTDRGVTMLCTREPGGTALGERIRDILLSGGIDKIDSMAELLLMFAARIEHVNQVIRPALRRG